MRIGILTLPFNNNYGGYLQSYALMTVLKKMGHQPTLIMRRHNKTAVTLSFKIRLAIKGLLKTILKFKQCQIIYDVEYSFKHDGKNMLKFVVKYMQPQTPFLYDNDSLREYCNDKFDAYIVGSDQVWRAIYVPDIKNYFLDFTKGWNVKRIAYAASFGTDRPEYTDSQIQECKILLEKFDAVSVREMSGLEVFKRFHWQDAFVQCVLDPTLLLSSEDYNQILSKIKSKSYNKIFYYVLDRDINIDKVLNQTSSLLGLSLYGISNIQNSHSGLISIEEWLSNIRDSKFIITDSFHGMVFSIIFHKPFMVCVNMKRGADRFTNLLDELGLSDRILKKGCNLGSLVNSKINWKGIDEKIDLLKEKSMLFLKQNLS